MLFEARMSVSMNFELSWLKRSSRGTTLVQEKNYKGQEGCEGRRMKSTNSNIMVGKFEKFVYYSCGFSPSWCLLMKTSNFNRFVTFGFDLQTCVKTKIVKPKCILSVVLVENLQHILFSFPLSYKIYCKCLKAIVQHSHQEHPFIINLIILQL